MLGNFLKKLMIARVLFWVTLITVGVVMLAFQVRAKVNEAAANVASLEVSEEPKIPVTLQTLSPTNWESWRSYYGQAKASRTHDITSYVREIVRDVRVQVGDKVRAGETVATLLRADYAAKAQAVETSYEEASLNYKRLLELHKKGGIAQTEVEKAYSLLKSEEANVQASRSTLQRTELKSNIDGIVSFRNVEPGEVAEVGKSLLSIVDLSDMEAQLLVSKKDISVIEKDTPVEIIVDGAVSKGRVKRLSPEAQSGSGLYPVVVELGPESPILPGTYLEGRFRVDRKSDVIVVPSNIVIYSGSEQYIYLAEGDKAKKVQIQTGEGRNGQVIVTSGLKAGDQLIVSGNRTLFDGALIVNNVSEDGK